MPGNFASGTAGITASSELNRLAAGLQGTFGWSVQSGAVTFSSGLIFNVAAIAAGDYTVNSVSGSVYAGGTTTLATQDPTNPRVDIIVITSAGAVSNVTGTPAALTTTSGPVPPTPSASQLEIARIYVPISGTALSASSITDRRTALGGYVPNRQTFAASGTWTKPTGTWTLVRAWGGGGGGGGGHGAAAANQRGGGGSGGAGACTEIWLLASTLAATETVTIAAGGTAGTGGSGGVGTVGGVGGNTTFGSWATAFGGGGGEARQPGGRGGGGGGSLSVGVAGGSGSQGGFPSQSITIAQGTGGNAVGSSGAAGSSGAVAGFSAEFGGAGGGGGADGSGVVGGAGGSARFGGGAGGGGGEVTVGNAASTGGAGGKSNASVAGGGGAGGAGGAGTNAGTAGTTGVGTNYGGSGGGGGGGSTGATGGAGAVGGAKGGGAGGGGGGTSVGGAGGVGGVGWMEVITF